LSEARLRIVVVVAFAALASALLASLGVTARGGEQDADPAGVQRCNTRCQTVQTNCAVKCDGDVACIEKCKGWAAKCVRRCSAGDGGVPGDAAAGG
jgi:hypothetical protein